MRTVKDYLQMLKNLLPRGDIWDVQKGSNFDKLLHAHAHELTRLDGETYRFIKEMNPQYSIEALTDWERVLSLPDTCLGNEQTIHMRRLMVLRKLMRGQNFSEKYLLNLCKLMGYEEAYITEFTPFMVDHSKVGERLNTAVGGAYLDKSNEVPNLILDKYAAWRFVIFLHLGKSQTRYFQVNSSKTEERLITWGDKTIECIINREKPAHIIVLFGYDV